MYTVIALISAVIWAVVWGFVVKSVNENKGYEGGFWLGFWLGWIGLIIVLSKQNYQPSNMDATHLMHLAEETEEQYQMDSRSAKERHQKDLLKNGGWKCACCNKVNPSYLTTCSCGAKQKPYGSISEDSDSASRPFRICPHCRKLHKTFVYECDCGYGQKSRHESESAISNSAAGTQLAMEKLTTLKQLLDSGVLTQEEFDRKKQELLEQI